MVEIIKLPEEIASSYIELFAEILEIEYPTREQDIDLFFIRLKSAIKENHRQVEIVKQLRMVLNQIQNFR